MTRLLLSTALVGFMAAQLPAIGPALAQEEHHDDHGGGHAPAPHPEAMRGPAQGPAMHRPAPQDDHHAAAPGPAAAPPAMAMRRDDHHAPGPAMAGPHMAGPRPAPLAGGPRGAGRADFSTYRRAFNAPHQFHAPAYRRPSGWYAHRWTYGEILPRFFWTRDYWLSDFYDFGLMPPPPGTIWVRDGADALLIDQYSGEIIQVDYGVFY